jgi:hypothetical protein
MKSTESSSPPIVRRHRQIPRPCASPTPLRILPKSR